VRPSRCLGAALAAAAALSAGASSARAAVVVVTAKDGDVSATLTYVVADLVAGNQVPPAHLAIERAGVSYYDQPVASRFCGRECWVETSEIAPPGSGGPLHVVDLDGDGQPDVVLDLYTGGAHCCSVAQVYRYDPGVSTYRLVERNFGDPGAVLTDIAGDGRLELESADDRFAYQFAPYAWSGLPRRIWRFSGGRFKDVTRGFPNAVRADAKVQFGRFLANRRAGHGLGFIAAWAADEYLLGRKALVKRTLAREARHHRLRDAEHYAPTGHAFVRALRRFLQRTGYA
jgi:hypothetical protein